MPECTKEELDAGKMTSADGTTCIEGMDGGRGRRRTMKVKTLRRMLKAKGKKTTGKKATLMKRLHMRGGGPDGEKEGPNEGGRRRRSRRREEEEGGRRRRSRRSRGIFHF